MKVTKYTVRLNDKLVDIKPRTYKGTVDEFIDDICKLNSTQHYLYIWKPGNLITIPLTKEKSR